MTIDFTTIATILPSLALVGSGVLNWVQYRASKKGNELNNFEKQLDVLSKLQELKDEKYQAALKSKDIEIESLKRELQYMKEQQIPALKTLLDKNTEKLIILQTAVNKLIGGGCKRMSCQQRVPYPIDELGDVLGLIEKD